MKKPKLFIRADGGSQIGMGHLVRCSALAQMLQSDFDITFFCKEIPESFKIKLRKEKFGQVRIENENQFFKELDQQKIVVLDGYKFDTLYQKKIKSKGCKLVCIDDLADKFFVADLLINHSPSISKEVYLTEDYTKFALGLNYVLLRKEFFQLTKEKKSYKNGFKKIFLSFGGSKNIELLEKYLGFLNLTDTLEIFIVVSDIDIYKNLLKKVEGYSKKIYLYHDLNALEIIKLLKIADLAIVPSSTLSFEVLACNTPMITGYFVDNQKKIHNGLSKFDQIVVLGDFNLALQTDFLKTFYTYESKVIKQFSGFNIISKLTPNSIKKKFKYLLS